MIVIPYTPARLRPETARWGVIAGAEFHNVSGDPLSYWRMFRTLWTDLSINTDLVIIGQDVVPDDAALSGMVECPRRWCQTHYAMREQDGNTRQGFGCTRFGLALRTEFPDLAWSVGPGGDESVHGGESCHIAVALSLALLRRGADPHYHGANPPVNTLPAAAVAAGNL